MSTIAEGRDGRPEAGRLPTLASGRGSVAAGNVRIGRCDAPERERRAASAPQILEGTQMKKMPCLGRVGDSRATTPSSARRLVLLGAMTMLGCLSAPLLSAAHANPKPAAPRTLVPKRSLQAIPDLIDLTPYYNASLDDDWLLEQGANLSSMPKGVHTFAGAAFDVRGVLQLAGSPLAKGAEAAYPDAIRGIKVGFKGRRLHFLQGAASGAADGTTIGEYVLHYADGRSARLPVVYQRHVRDWFVEKNGQVPSDADVAWTGENEAARKQGCSVQLYRYTANNPFPDVALDSIDMVSTTSGSAPFLVALTVEATETNYESFRNPRIDNAVVPRSPQATPDLVDLTSYYNYSLDDDFHNHAGHDLQDVPKGVQTLGGVAFDVRGLIQLASTRSLGMTGVTYPEAVMGIRVNRSGRQLHFLHACGWSAPAGAKVGEYVVHYANGQTRSVPLVYQQNMLDWWFRPGDAPPSGAEVVWQGQDPSTRRNGFKTRLLKYSWENPFPDTEISSIDFVSSMTEAGPFLVAITVR
jgi:hypothetical protein